MCREEDGFSTRYVHRCQIRQQFIDVISKTWICLVFPLVLLGVAVVLPGLIRKGKSKVPQRSTTDTEGNVTAIMLPP